jgi:predicted ThiF/HesA family dinucleotide-utilizing enzyme
MAQIEELREQIEELEDNNIPTTYIIVRHTETEFNESFSAWGVCGRTEHHTKAKALERAEDFADDLSLDEDITDITVKYDGREREYVDEDYCYMTYYYIVEWVENEYEEQIVSAFGVEAWYDCTQ